MRTIRQLALFAACATGLWAQFSTGSTGADGAYNPTVSGDFDPVALGINSAGDNVFNFTTINIPVGVTIKLRASKLRNQAVTWLATGNVTIAGTLDLSGAAAQAINTNSTATIASTRIPPEPGPGGYPGGLGARASVAAESGAGPGGGPAGATGAVGANAIGASASYIGSGITTYRNVTGTGYGSYLLVPLYGGSGGGGSGDSGTSYYLGGTGGAGGGGIRIASNTQISVTGTINANGGNGGSGSAPYPGGPGSGGAVHLVAPTIAGNGSITVSSGTWPSPYNASPTPNGITRFSYTTNTFTGQAGNLVTGPLYLPPANSTLAEPSINVTQVNGVAVPANPGGQYLLPDVIVSAPGPVTVNIAGSNIPLGTVVTLRLTSDTGGDQLLSCSGLAGTVAASTSSCSATFPFSISIAEIRATW